MASRASGSVRGGLSLVGGGGDGTTTAGGGGPGGGASGPVTTLLQALNASACGRDAAPILGAAFEDFLRGCAGGPGGPPLVRVLAYEGARSARPGTLAAGDWEAVVEAAEADLAPGSAAPGEVQAAALAALAALPADAVGLAAGSGAGPGASGCIVPALQAGPPAARPAAARAAAVLLTRDAWLVHHREIVVNGMSPTEARRHKQIGFVPQSPALLPWRTVEANARLLLDINRRASPTTPSRASVGDLLDEVGLGDFRDAYPHELSGGMQQRVGLVHTSRSMHRSC